MRAASGVWAWFSGHDAVFDPHGTGSGGEGSVALNRACSHGSLAIHWSAGYVDRVTLSPDGMHL